MLDECNESQNPLSHGYDTLLESGGGRGARQHGNTQATILLADTDPDCVERILVRRPR